MRAAALSVIAFLLLAAPAWAHFAVVIPSSEAVGPDDNPEVTLSVAFTHPFEQRPMDMERPRAFGVLAGGERTDLISTLKRSPGKRPRSWRAAFRFRHPGDHIFYMEPEPYFEAAEDKFIIHYTKVVVAAFGLSDAWDRAVGMEAEIIPLTRPYGLWAGNVFQGRVMMHGKPAPGIDVEVEYMNDGGRVKAPSDPYITQVVRADDNGVFTYAMPRAGWWGFAALGAAPYTIKHEGKDCEVEVGGVLWIRTIEMKTREMR